MSSFVSVSKSDGVLVVRLRRPEARNAINPQLARELADAVEGSASAGVGALALLAAGEHFCVGGDVRAVAAADDPGTFVRALADELHRVVRAVAGSVPVVTGVRGWAAGAGFSLALATDLRSPARARPSRPRTSASAPRLTAD